MGNASPDASLVCRSRNATSSSPARRKFEPHIDQAFDGRRRCARRVSITPEAQYASSVRCSMSTTISRSVPSTSSFFSVRSASRARRPRAPCWPFGRSEPLLFLNLREAVGARPTERSRRARAASKRVRSPASTSSLDRGRLLRRVDPRSARPDHRFRAPTSRPPSAGTQALGLASGRAAGAPLLPGQPGGGAQPAGTRRDRPPR